MSGTRPEGLPLWVELQGLLLSCPAEFRLLLAPVCPAVESCNRTKYRMMRAWLPVRVLKP